VDCLWKEISERDARGFRRLRCIRPGCTLEAVSPHPYERINSYCEGWPLWWEVDYWLHLLYQLRGLRPLRHARLLLHFGPLLPLPKLDREGPGTELVKLLHMLRAGLTCVRCLHRAAEINALGVAACHDKKAAIVEWLNESYRKTPRLEVMLCATRAVRLGIITPFNARRWLRDPLGSLLEEALRRAEIGSAAAAA
jgi:hypothetical protein